IRSAAQRSGKSHKREKQEKNSSRPHLQSVPVIIVRNFGFALGGLGYDKIKEGIELLHMDLSKSASEEIRNLCLIVTAGTPSGIGACDSRIFGIQPEPAEDSDIDQPVIPHSPDLETVLRVQTQDQPSRGSQDALRLCEDGRLQTDHVAQRILNAKSRIKTAIRQWQPSSIPANPKPDWMEMRGIYDVRQPDINPKITGPGRHRINSATKPTPDFQNTPRFAKRF